MAQDWLLAQGLIAPFVLGVLIHKYIIVACKVDFPRKVEKTVMTKFWFLCREIMAETQPINARCDHASKDKVDMATTCQGRIPNYHNKAFHGNLMERR